MADVSVEFGAKDTGLEQTLKTVQDELTRLNSEVKSGELSFGELQQAMRKIAQAEKVEEQLKGMASGMNSAGVSAMGAEPKVNALGKEAQAMGDKVEGAGQQANSSAGLFDTGFAKISAAFAVGNIAAKAFEKAIELVFSAARAVVDGFGEALDLGGRLDALSKRTGETAGNLFVLENAFKRGGMSAEQVGTVINKLQGFMQDASNGGERQTAAMNNLGISLDQLQGKTPTEQMGIFATAIKAIEDPTKRAAAASDVFGEGLGGKLLPLLNEFPETLDKVRAETGSMADVMDESAATFATAGDTINAVKAKFSQFAAGILSEVIPEIQSLGTSMEQVDAAGLGRDIGSALTPVLRDLNGLVGEAKMLMDQLSFAEQQAREDTGALGATYRGTQGALAVFNNAQFDAIKFIAPFDESVEALRQTFVGYKKDQDGAIVGVQELGEAAAETTPKVDKVTEKTERFAMSLQDIGSDGSVVFSDINNGATDFKSLIDDGNVSLSDMSGEISGQVTLANEHVALVGELNVSLGEANEKASEQLDTIEKQITAEQLRNEKIAERQAKSLADYELQIQINEELAKGNKEEAKRLESQREHTKLTERIMRETNVTEVAAANLATNLLNSKAAAGKLTESIGGVRGGAEGAKNELISVKGVIADIEKAKLEDAPQRLLERTREARGELKSMKDFIGEDLSKMSLTDIIKKLGIDGSKLQNDRERLVEIEKAVAAIGSADPADITPEVDLPGVNDRLEKVKEFLKTTGTEKPDVTPKIEQDSLKTAVDTAKETIQAGLTQNPVQVNLDAEKAIGQIREGLKDQIDIAIGSSEGTKHLLSIDGIVGKIEELLSKIEGKLPMQALA
jgi:hypothetical protein